MNRRTLSGVTLRVLLFILPCLATIGFVRDSAAEGDDTGTVVAANMSAEDLSEMQALLEIIETETEIATQTKMNADYTPGIVTVLRGYDLEALGARTVWEALGLVPGVFNTISNSGTNHAIIRGVGFSAFYGNMKIMIDSVPVNLTYEGDAPAVMLLPVEMVERIDVIRGPGTALYGEFSYAGVVNVILKKGTKSVYANGGSYSTYGGGMAYTHGNQEEGLVLDVNMSGWDTDGADVNSGRDAVVTGSPTPSASFSPGPTNEDDQTKALSLGIGYKKIAVKIFGAERRKGHYFGMGALMPPSDEKDVLDRVYYINARMPLDVHPALKVDMNLLHLIGENRVHDHMVHPPGFKFPSPPGRPSPLIPPAGLWIGNYIKEARTEVSTDIKWNEYPGHNVLLRLSAANVELLESWGESNQNQEDRTIIYDTIIRLPDAQDGWMDAGKNRRILSAALEDQIAVSKAITVTGALRVDDYNDVGSAITPRLAAVWRIADPHLIKVQYARAFRPPTFSELYMPTIGGGKLGNPNVKPETAETYELGYIYRVPEMTGRATFFYMELDSLIVPTVEAGGRIPRQPQNARKTVLKGIELELERRLTESWTLSGNVSSMNSMDQSAGHINGSTDLLANAMLKGRITNNLLAAFRYQHVGTRFRPITETRDDLTGYDVMDVTMSWLDAFVPGLTLRIGLKNVLDADVKAASLNEATYLYDLPRPGRRWWASVKYDF